MKTRYIWLILGMAFSVTLAVVVGERLSSEAMAVIVGVVAGVAASIPTSLIVVWFATRGAADHAGAPRPAAVGDPSPVRREAGQRWTQPEMPPMIVVQQPATPVPPAGYPVQPVPARYARQWPAISPPRRYTVVGGADMPLEMSGLEAAQEVTWQQ